MKIALPYARNILHHAKKKESTIDKLFGYKISFTLCILCVYVPYEELIAIIIVSVCMPIHKYDD